MTLCFNLTQAHLAAKAGATYVSPFVGRLDDQNNSGMEVIEQILAAYRNYDLPTQVLTASADGAPGDNTNALEMAQLRNLGFGQEGDVETILGFQAKRHLELSGQLDVATRAAIDEIVDGDDLAVQTHLGKTDAQ